MDSKMGVLKIVLTVLFIIVCLALVVLVLMQEGKSAGLVPSAEQQKPTGAGIKVVPWRDVW